MDRKMLDRLVPLAYAGLVVASVLFFRSALAGIAIFGALVLAAYYSAVRQRLFAAERPHAGTNADGDGAGDNDGRANRGE